MSISMLKTRLSQLNYNLTSIEEENIIAFLKQLKEVNFKKKAILLKKEMNKLGISIPLTHAQELLASWSGKINRHIEINASTTKQYYYEVCILDSYSHDIVRKDYFISKKNLKEYSEILKEARNIIKDFDDGFDLYKCFPITKKEYEEGIKIIEKFYYELHVVTDFKRDEGFSIFFESTNKIDDFNKIIFEAQKLNKIDAEDSDYVDSAEMIDNETYMDATKKS